MCYECNKTCCATCLRHWLNRNRRCPTCRKKIQVSKLKRNVLVAEIIQTQNKVPVIVPEVVYPVPLNSMCPEHNEPITMNCQNCNQDMCVDCVNLDKHQTHQIRSIKYIYNSEKDKALEEHKNLDQYIEQLEDDSKRIEMSMTKKVNSAKDAMETITTSVNDYLKHQLERVSS